MVTYWYHILISVGYETLQEGMVDTNCLSLADCFDQLEISVIPGEYTVPSNWSLHMVPLGQHGCFTRIRGVKDSGIEMFHGIPSD